MASRDRWFRTTPLMAGLLFALAGIALTVVGIFRGNVPLSPRAIVVALVIGGGSWGVLAWAVATAAVDVEEDIAEGGVDQE